MKIQLAVDRVTLEEALSILELANPYFDVIEVGTSLFLDYGLEAVRQIRSRFVQPILADFKTMDEAEYEFNQIYSNGADIATVMGATSLDTLRICQRVATEYGKDYMIDIMEVSDEKIKELAEFDDAIIALHLPKDKDADLKAYIEDFVSKHHLDNKLAAAGGITLEDLPYLKEAGIEIAIVGSAITKSEHIKEIAKKFKEGA